MKKKQKITLYRIIITAVMLVVLQFLPITGIPRLIAYLAAYLVIGYDILRKAGKGILNAVSYTHLSGGFWHSSKRPMNAPTPPAVREDTRKARPTKTRFPSPRRATPRMTRPRRGPA